WATEALAPTADPGGRPPAAIRDDRPCVPRRTAGDRSCRLCGAAGRLRRGACRRRRPDAEGARVTPGDADPESPRLRSDRLAAVRAVLLDLAGVLYLA